MTMQDQVRPLRLRMRDKVPQKVPHPNTARPGRAGCSRILLIAAPQDPDWGQPRDWLTRLGGRVSLRSGPVPNVAIPTAAESAPDLVVADADHLKECGDVVGQVMALRGQLPGRPLILTSRLFTRHDFTPQSSGLCDVALQMPFARPVLILVVASLTGL